MHQILENYVANNLDPFCLMFYIDTSLDFDALERALNSIFKSQFDFLVESLVFKNEMYDVSALDMETYDFMKCSNYYVELEMLDEKNENLESFLLGYINVLKKLKKNDHRIFDVSFDDDISVF